MLTGPVEDQAALYGLIAKLRDLGLPLSAVNPVREVSEEQDEGSVDLPAQPGHK